MARMLASRYELVRRLAVGGMAEIWLARQHAAVRGFERTVVVKLLHAHLACDREQVEAFLDEGRLGAQLHHKNIAQVLDLGVDAESCFLVLEYLDGCDLARLVASQSLPVELASFAVREACEGLHHAHELADRDGRSLGIVHRDVSPSNVFVTRDGDIKLLDFGIARSRLRSNATRAGVIRGKVRYMSPEQAAGDAVDRRSDVFSLGVVLHELLTRRPLFDGPHDAAILDRVHKAPIPPPSSTNPGAVAFDAIVRGALDREVATRFATAAAFGHALSRVSTGDREQLRARLGALVAAVGPGPAAETVALDVGRPRPRAWRTIAVAATITVTGVLGGYAVYRGSRAEPAAAVDASSAPPRAERPASIVAPARSDASLAPEAAPTPVSTAPAAPVVPPSGRQGSGRSSGRGTTTRHPAARSKDGFDPGDP